MAQFSFEDHLSVNNNNMDMGVQCYFYIFGKTITRGKKILHLDSFGKDLTNHHYLVYILWIGHYGESYVVRVHALLHC